LTFPIISVVSTIRLCAVKGRNYVVVGTRHRMLAEATRSIGKGLLAWRIWARLGWYDLLARYRRSFIGPLWLILTLAFYTAALSLVYSTLFKTNIEKFIPLVATGMLLWTLIAGALGEGPQTFTESQEYIKQVRQPLFIYVCRVAWRHIVAFGHNFIVVIIVVVLTKGWPGPVFLLAIPGWLLVVVNLLWLLLVLSILGARFRDVQPIVNTLTQVVFFVTPIFWSVELLGSRKWIADLNPIYHLIEVVRAPLLGDVPSFISYLAATLMTCGGWLVALYLFARFRNRIIYWL